MIGKTTFFGDTVDYEYDEIKRKLSITIKNNKNPEIFEYVYKEKPFPTNLIEGYDGIYHHIFTTSYVNMNDNHQNDPSGKFTLYTLTKFEFTVESLFSFKYSMTPFSESKLVIMDDVIDYFYSPMKKIKVEINESTELYNSLRSYKELSEEDSQLNIVLNDEKSIKFRVNSNSYSRSHRTYFDGFHSELQLLDKNQRPNYHNLIGNIFSILNFFRFIYRTDFDGFNEIKYYGKFLIEESVRDIEGIFYSYSSSIEENLTNTIMIKPLEPHLSKIMDFFFKTDTLPNYYDSDTFSFSLFKQFVLFSNFDTFSNKLNMNDENLIEQKEISKDIKKYIDNNELFLKFKTENINRMINIIRDIRISYRNKMRAVIESNTALTKRVLKTHIAIDDFTKKMTKYRNDLMHGNKKTSISFDELKSIELILYVTILQIMGLTNLEIDSILEALFFIR